MPSEREKIVALVWPLADLMAHLSIDGRITLLEAVLAQEICNLPPGERDDELARVVRDALARHISVRVDAIARLQRAGRLPNPSYHLGQRQPRWDRDAVDTALAGGVASTDPREAVQGLVAEILP